MSTLDQNNELQISELTRYIAARGWILSEVHQDKMSGARRDRPGLLALMESVRLRRIDVVVVLKLDRFGRSTLDLLDNIRELESCGVRFLATTQGLDTDKSNPISRFLLTVLTAVGELEREFIGERVRAGITRAKQKGVKFGPKLKVFNRERALTLREMGWSIDRFARELEVGKGTIHRLVKHVPQVPFQKGLKLVEQKTVRAVPAAS